MKNIQGVSYRFDDAVRAELAKRPRLAGMLREPRNGRSNLEIVRILANSHYPHIESLLDFVDAALPSASALVAALLKQTDPMEFENRLAELYLFQHLAARLDEMVGLPQAKPSEKQADIEVLLNDQALSVEIYGPRYLFGFQLVDTYVTLVLKYLEIDRGYTLKVLIKPTQDHDLFFAYGVPPEMEVRPWLSDLAASASDWLTGTLPAPVLEIAAPSGGDWTVVITLLEVHSDARDRCIIHSTATRSDDARLHFEVGSPASTASGWWGRAVRKKMEERQAGAHPTTGLIRILVIDFTAIETSFPDFLCWPDIASRIDAAVRILAEDAGSPLCYDVVLPARLSQNCCFGEAVWLNPELTANGHRVLDKAGLTIRCRPHEPIVFDPFMLR